MIYVLYRPSSEHAREVEEFGRQLEKRRLNHQLLSVDSREGAVKAQSYGMMGYPAVLAVRESNGQAIQTWSERLPTIADVEYYGSGSI